MSDTEVIKSVGIVRDHHGADIAYYRDAERAMEVTWNARIRAFVEQSDTSCVLDLACGHGRNSAKLAPLSRELFLVDVNQHCIDACRARFGEKHEGCVMRYFVNDGFTLPFIADGAISLVYSWDSVVHFDPIVVERYVHEFARIMRPGARGFVHHSNYGTVKPDSNWLENPHWRSCMTAELFARYCNDAGLRLLGQQLIKWELPDLDCISTFEKPA